MGLIAHIYKHQGNSSSAGGLSSRVDDVTIVNIEGPFAPTEERPAVLLVVGNVRGSVKIVPAMKNPGSAHFYVPTVEPDHAGPMFGGCYVDAGGNAPFDEAVAELIGHHPDGPVALHDRFESAELARAMSQ